MQNRVLMGAGLVLLLHVQFMFYTRPAHMTQTLLDGANRQPVLPTSEADGETDSAAPPAGQQQLTDPPSAMPASPTAAASAAEEPEDGSSRVGVIADSTPSSSAICIDLSRLSLRAHSSSPGLCDLEGAETQRLAQRALRTLQSQKASLKERGSWPGGERGCQWPSTSYLYHRLACTPWMPAPCPGSCIKTGAFCLAYKL